MSDSDIIPPDPNAVLPPSTPTYTVSADGTAVTLSWVNTATNATAVEIEEIDPTVPDSNFYTIQRWDPSVNSAVIGVQANGMQYEFEVRAVGVGESAYSSPITVTPYDSNLAAPAGFADTTNYDDCLLYTSRCV